jgi:A/G-specific adenine glycosylase
MGNLEKEVSERLITWYNKNARTLPWRETTEPYKIWLSEIILQQTTVKQGLPYYNKFVSKYPSIEDLASSELDDVLKLWQGLGYYSRARNLHETSRFIYNELGGEFPKNYNALLKLKGVGKYTAAAIASFCYKEPQVVVDGNVKRFISRLYGITSPVDLTETEKKIRMGALQCIKQKPDCSSCTMRSICVAQAQNTVDKIPVKSKKIKRRTRYFYFCVAVDPIGNTFVRKRTENDIWKGLYEFPLLESKQLLDNPPKLSAFGIKNSVLLTAPSRIYKHQLTHQKLISQFIYYTLENKIKAEDLPDYQIISFSNIKDFAVPRLIDLYLSDLSITLF